MGFLSAYTGTYRVEFGNDFWVDLKKYITQGGQEQAEKALMKMVTVAGSPEARPDVASYRKHMVLASIDQWNLTDDNEQILPISMQSVQRLPIPVFNELWQQVSERNSTPERSSEEQIDFRE